MSKIFIISGPSGAGEDSIINELKKTFDIEVVITTSTRKMRERESNGSPYYFIEREDFEKGIEENRFFEWARQYNDNLYGVTFEEIERVRNSGKIPIWKIEYKGVITAKGLLKDSAVAIMINAPLNQIAERIRKRDNASEEFIKERMEYTKEWLKHKDVYDYEVMNKDGKLHKAVKQTIEVIKKESSN